MQEKQNKVIFWFALNMFANEIFAGKHLQQ